MTIKSQTYIQKWFFILMSLIIFSLFWQIVKPFAIVLLLAMIIAIILAPLDTRVRSFIKNKKVVAFLMMLLVLIVIVVPLFIGAVIMVNQAAEIIQTSFSQNSWIYRFDLTNNYFINSLPQVVQTEIYNLDFVLISKNIAQWIFVNIGNLFSSAGKMLFGTFIFFVALYYFLVDRKKIHKLALELSPFKDTLDTKIVKRIINTIRSVVFGALIIAVLKGILAIIGLAIFGVPGSVLWGSMVAIASQIPMIGATLILGPAVIYLFVLGHNGAAVGLLIWSVVVVGFTDNLLAPKLVGSSTKMHELLILISILGGLQVFGPIGFIVGPTILAGVMVVIELYKDGILVR